MAAIQPDGFPGRLNYLRVGADSSQSWDALKAAVLTRDGEACATCGASAESVRAVIPLAEGGTFEHSNFRAACWQCVKVARAPREPAMIVHHELARRALMFGGVREYRAYVVARERLHAGQLHGRHGRAIHPRNGVVRTDSLIGALASLAGKPLGARRNVHDTIRAGQGLYWDIEGPNLRFPSPDTLAARLGLQHAGTRLTPYPISELRKGTASFADLLQDALTPNQARRLARATVQAMTGRSPSTQKRREAKGQARYTDGEGQAPINRGREVVNFSNLLGRGFSASDVAGQYRGEGLFEHRANILRQSPKPFQTSTPSRRRTPKKKHIPGHRLNGHASGDRFIHYGDGSTKALVSMVQTSRVFLAAVPRLADFTFEDFLKERNALRCGTSFQTRAKRDSSPAKSGLVLTDLPGPDLQAKRAGQHTHVCFLGGPVPGQWSTGERRAA